MRLTVAFLALLFSISLCGQQLAVTIDDAPFGFSVGMTEEQKVESFKDILKTLKKYKAKATFFVTTGNLTDGTKMCLDLAVAAGHQLGNHTHNHLDLNQVKAHVYIQDIDSCNQIANKWLNSPYFRYSKLHRGDTREKRDSVYQFLEEKGHVIAPVTIDNNEWVYNRGYTLAMRVNDTEKMNELGKDYIDHMKSATARYQKLSNQLTGRDIPQILLIHANAINAKYLNELLGWHKKEGWEFVTLDDAMNDPFYKLEEDYVGPYGLSQLDRIKVSRSEKN